MGTLAAPPRPPSNSSELPLDCARGGHSRYRRWKSGLPDSGAGEAADRVASFSRALRRILNAATRSIRSSNGAKRRCDSRPHDDQAPAATARRNEKE